MRCCCRRVNLWECVWEEAFCKHCAGVCPSGERQLTAAQIRSRYRDRSRGAGRSCITTTWFYIQNIKIIYTHTEPERASVFLQVCPRPSESWTFFLSLCSGLTSLVSVSGLGAAGSSAGWASGGNSSSLLAVASVRPSQSAVNHQRSARLLARGRVKALNPRCVCFNVTSILTAGGSTGEKIGHHLSFALDCDHASVLQSVVVGAQDLVQVRGHLKAEGGRVSERAQGYTIQSLAAHICCGGDERDEIKRLHLCSK